MKYILRIRYYLYFLIVLPSCAIMKYLQENGIQSQQTYSWAWAGLTKLLASFFQFSSFPTFSVAGSFKQKYSVFQLRFGAFFASFKRTAFSSILQSSWHNSLLLSVIYSGSKSQSPVNNDNAVFNLFQFQECT